jgi:hypothetical protein
MRNDIVTGECRLCSQRLKIRGRLVFQIGCGHQFHEDCLRLHCSRDSGMPTNRCPKNRIWMANRSIVTAASNTLDTLWNPTREKMRRHEPLIRAVSAFDMSLTPFVDVQ